MTDKEKALKRVDRQIDMLTKDIEAYENHSNVELRNACITYREELRFYQALHDSLTSTATSPKSCEGLVKALEKISERAAMSKGCCVNHGLDDAGQIADKSLSEHRKNMGEW